MDYRGIHLQTHLDGIGVFKIPYVSIKKICLVSLSTRFRGVSGTRCWSWHSPMEEVFPGWITAWTWIYTYFDIDFFLIVVTFGWIFIYIYKLVHFKGRNIYSRRRWYIRHFRFPEMAKQHSSNFICDVEVSGRLNAYPDTTDCQYVYLS